MRELDKDLGKIYQENGYFYLEKIFDDLAHLMDEDSQIKRNAKNKGFKVKDYQWMIEDNPYYDIETIINDGNESIVDPNRYVLKLKLEYYK
jgi:hypothetical protein